MLLNKNIQVILGCESDYDSAKTTVFGAPFDSTTSYRPGARFGPKQIRSESWGLETYSPYQNIDIAEFDIFDCGDLELSIGDTEKALSQIESFSKGLLDSGKLPVMLGGEHIVTLGAVRAAVKKYPELYIIHFDAHIDLRSDYLGVKLSHACVVRRIWELVGDERIYQFGIRSGDKSEFLWAKDHVFTNLFDFSSLNETIAKLSEKPVYFTLDLDVLDPSVFPGTGTPEPGGVSFDNLLDAVLKVCELHVVGCDMTELSPPYDPSGISTAAACKILREMLIALNKKQ